MKKVEVFEVILIATVAGLIIYFHDPLMRFKCAMALFNLTCKM